MASNAAGNYTGSLHISGKRGYVQILDEDTGDTTSYPFAEWTLNLRAEFVKRNSYLSLGLQDGVSGFKSAQLSARGPYALALTPLAVGGFYWFYLGLTDDGPYELSMFGHISELVPSNKAEGAPDIEIRADSAGSISTATV